jgi:hypothetical protein
MTAEIAILNKSAVALAADSKVTIGSSGSKTFDTVNKIFTLSKVHPVGLMIFGNAEFMRYPWETIVKLYRTQKGLASHRTVEEWGSDFCGFVSRFGVVTAAERRENFQSLASSILQDVRNLVRKTARDRRVSINSENYISLTEATIDHLLDAHVGSKNVFTDLHMSKVRREFGGLLRDSAKLYFGYEGMKITRKVLNFIERSLQSNTPSPLSSGVVIAGFGANEVFPAFVHFQTDGYIGSKLKLLRISGTAVTRDNSAIVAPFAQKDMVCRFMDGIDPDYEAFANARLRTLLAATCLHVLEKYGAVRYKNNTVRRSILTATQRGFEDHRKTTSQFQHDKFSFPIVQMVAMLPKDELPILAESLVSLTSLKRHVSSDAETVGGPTDVALISKTDGFIWIKRKHYFKAELNPHFAANYMQNLGKGVSHGKITRKLRTTSTRRTPPKVS